MAETSTELTERIVPVEAPESVSAPRPTESTGPTIPSVAERLMLPVMWVAIGVVASITTPAPPESVPAVQAFTAEALGWAGFIALVGMIAAAVAGRSSIRGWSAGLGAVGLVGLASCQMFGHPIFSSAWGLSQVAMVSGALLVTGRLAVR